MIYILDTNVFISASLRHYGLDFCTGFWEWIIRARNQGILHSLDSVYKEIVDIDKKPDDLARWATANRHVFDPFAGIPWDQETTKKYDQLANWTTRNYPQGACQEFKKGADPHLIAYAAAHGRAVVTCETTIRRKKKIKIPVACKSFAPVVPCIFPFDMLRAENVKLILGP